MFFEKKCCGRRGRSTLCMIASYFCFVLLIMPQEKAGLVQTAVLLAVGAFWFCRKKPDLTIRRPGKWPVAASLCVLAVMGPCFYTRWMTTPKILTLARLLHLPAPLLVTATAAAMTLCSFYAVLYGAQRLCGFLRAAGEKADWKRGLCICLLMAGFAVALSQIMIGEEFLSMGSVKFLWNALIAAVVNLMLYCLLGRPFPASALGSGLVIFLSAANAYVFQFRRRLLEPVDIFSVGTALNVADNYSLLPIPAGVSLGLGLWLAALVGLWIVLPRKEHTLEWKKRGILSICCIMAVIAIACYCAILTPYHWEKQGAKNNGYLLDFTAKIKETVILPPESYSPESVEQLANRYEKDENGEVKRKPHVIVIMDEAFSDLSVHGDLQADVMPFVSSLQENTLRGYALASVYGGNTANSEYEFLTGNTMAWLSENAVPYQQYIRADAYSMVSYLKGRYDYHCVAMHPYLSSGWNRPAVYGYMGFDEVHFLEDFPQKDLLRGYVSDREMFESVIAAFEQHRQQPLFLFGVTMQNHGGYSSEDFVPGVSLPQELYDPEAEQYLSLIRETDRAVEYLIQYFASVEEEVVIVFFGDHQPILKEEFLRALGNAEETPEERQKRYMVPFFVWANYDIPEEDGIVTSLNFLSNYVYEAAGLELPPYNRFLSEMAKDIPAIHSNGFYSAASGGYLSFDQASEAERRWFADYRMLQYDSIWAGSERSETFFPMP